MPNCRSDPTAMERSLTGHTYIWSICCLNAFAFRLHQRFTIHKNENTQLKYFNTFYIDILDI